MNITDEMVQQARETYADLGMRAVLQQFAAVLAVQPARVALPALPEPSGHTWGYDARMNMTRTPNGHYTANDVYEYGKKCLAAAGLTVAKGGAK